MNDGANCPLLLRPNNKHFTAFASVFYGLPTASQCCWHFIQTQLSASTCYQWGINEPWMNHNQGWSELYLDWDSSQRHWNHSQTAPDGWTTWQRMFQLLPAAELNWGIIVRDEISCGSWKDGGWVDSTEQQEIGEKAFLLSCYWTVRI